MLDAAATAATMDAVAGQPLVERRRRLSPTALAVTNQKVRKAYSPIVIAGGVRIADFVLISAIGISLYFIYVVPLSGFYWEYIAAIFGMTAAAVISFQAADIYEVQVVLNRLSGDDGSWYRMNRTFLTELRKQFLQWRSLTPQRMLYYIESSRNQFGESTAESIVTPPIAISKDRTHRAVRRSTSGQRMRSVKARSNSSRTTRWLARWISTSKKA